MPDADALAADYLYRTGVWLMKITLPLLVESMTWSMFSVFLTRGND